MMKKTRGKKSHATVPLTTTKNVQKKTEVGIPLIANPLIATKKRVAD